MLRIPFVPTAYPDETFGSLLTRLVLYNGTGLWRSLLEESGYGRRTISPFFAMPVKDARLDGLLPRLGYTYEDMLRQLTALPFWLAFNNATRPRSQIVVPGKEGGGTRLFLVGKEAHNVGARFCPACLGDDFDVFGEPYLHRHHQLPVALVCAKHGASLRMSCKACGIIALPFNKTLLRPPALRCECGQDLTARSGSPSLRRNSLQRLSQFAESTLSCANAPWTQNQIRSVLKSNMNCGQRDIRRKALELLESTYGPMQRTSSGLALTLKPIDAGGVQLKLSTETELFRAPEFCALLSAIGLKFEDFANAASAIHDAPARSRSSQAGRQFTVEQVHFDTVEQARLEFDRFARESPRGVATRLQKSFPKLYWSLRLQATSWRELREPGLLRQIPSVDNDRAKILQAVKLGMRVASQMRRSGSFIRASIRDAVWLENQLRELNLNEAADDTKAQAVQRERAVALSRAIFSVLRLERRPARIHAGLLSKVVKISMHQAQHTIANCPPLRILIDAINAGKDRRMAMWATRALIDAGQSPTPKDVLLRAGLNTTRVNRQFAIAAIEKSDRCRP